MTLQLDIDKKEQYYIIIKKINVAIRATYYIFRCRIRNGDTRLNEILIFELFNLKQPIVICLVARFSIVHS